MRGLLLAALLCGATAGVQAAPATDDGDEILVRFHAARIEPGCGSASARWQRHYASAADRLARHDEVALALFGYVLEKVRAAGLPGEFALIPFVESRYRADARSPGGQTGLWQFTAATARRHGLVVRGAVDERLSVASSTAAAIAYLGRLHRMFGRDWRSTAIAYNAGEGALKASRRGGRALSGIAASYPAKLQALACLLDARGRQPRWQAAVARPVPRLALRRLPGETRDLARWAHRQGFDPALVRALNPGWHAGSLDVLVPAGAGRARAGKAN